MDKNEILKLLRQKLRANYEEYMRRLQNQTPPSLIEQAAEIAAAKEVYELMMDDCDCYSLESLEYLLRFQNPLEVARDHWLDDVEFAVKGTLNCMMEGLPQNQKNLAYALDQTVTEQSADRGMKLC